MVTRIGLAKTLNRPSGQLQKIWWMAFSFGLCAVFFPADMKWGNLASENKAILVLGYKHVYSCSKVWPFNVVLCGDRVSLRGPLSKPFGILMLASFFSPRGYHMDFKSSELFYWKTKKQKQKNISTYFWPIIFCSKLSISTVWLYISTITVTSKITIKNIN